MVEYMAKAKIPFIPQSGRLFTLSHIVAIEELIDMGFFDHVNVSFVIFAPVDVV